MPDAPTQQADADFIADSLALRAFVKRVQETMAQVGSDVPTGLDALRADFAGLLANTTWLPYEYSVICPTSGMGGGIGQWLLYRAPDQSFTIFSLVVPAGSSTPVHDHLAWGLVGLYRGEQEETVYRRLDDGTRDEHANLEVTEVRTLRAGDFYTLLPPEGDIHKVSTTSVTPSISIHVLGNDCGCVWRHAFEPDANRVRSFRSGYSNLACDE
jgi:predicted metal-dependent enzyme (double-stranded beta helix superfamily)